MIVDTLHLGDLCFGKDFEGVVKEARRIEEKRKRGPEEERGVVASLGLLRPKAPPGIPGFYPWYARASPGNSSFSWYAPNGSDPPPPPHFFFLLNVLFGGS